MYSLKKLSSLFASLAIVDYTSDSENGIYTYKFTASNALNVTATYKLVDPDKNPVLKWKPEKEKERYRKIFNLYRECFRQKMMGE